MVPQYTAIALQPAMRGCNTRADIKKNIEHIYDNIDGAVWLSSIDTPVRLIAIPEGALQSFNDEVIDMDHVEYANKMAIEIPGEETELLAKKCKEYNTYIIAQAKCKHPEFPNRFFNSAFLIDPKDVNLQFSHNFTVIKETASKGVKKMRDILLSSNT